MTDHLTLLHDVTDAQIMNMITAPETGEPGGTITFNAAPDPRSTATVRFDDFCTVISELFSLTVWDTTGSPIHADGDRFYHVDQFAVAFRQGEDEQEFELSSEIARPHSTPGSRGGLLITPVNDAVTLDIYVDGYVYAVHPLDVLTALKSQGLIGGFEDAGGLISRHLRSPEPVFEVWPDMSVRLLATE